MNKLITVTFDGKVFKPKTPLPLDLDLDTTKEYQIELITDSTIEKKESIGNHQGFLNGYVPEDEGLYDDY